MLDDAAGLDELRESDEGRSFGALTVLQLVQLGRVRRAGPGVCSVTRAAAPGCLLASTSHAIGKRLCGRVVRTSVTPEFMLKQNSALVGTTAGRSNETPRPEIGDYGVSWLARRRPCLRTGAGICHPQRSRGSFVPGHQPVARRPTSFQWWVVVPVAARLDKVTWPRFGSDRHAGLSRRRPS
jgi:hypothetical protein